MSNFNIWPIANLGVFDDLMDSEDLRKQHLSDNVYSGTTYIEALYQYISFNIVSPMELPRYFCIMDVDNLYIYYAIFGNMESRIAMLHEAQEYRKEFLKYLT